MNFSFCRNSNNRKFVRFQLQWFILDWCEFINSTAA